MTQLNLGFDEGQLNDTMTQIVKDTVEEAAEEQASLIRYEMLMGYVEAAMNGDSLQWPGEIAQLVTVETGNAECGCANAKVVLKAATDKDLLKAQIVEEGNHPPIFSKPGQMVFDDNLNLHMSHATAAVELPWYEKEGAHCIANAKTKFEGRLQQIFNEHRQDLAAAVRQSITTLVT